MPVALVVKSKLLLCDAHECVKSYLSCFFWLECEQPWRSVLSSSTCIPQTIPNCHTLVLCSSLLTHKDVGHSRFVRRGAPLT